MRLSIRPALGLAAVIGLSAATSLAHADDSASAATPTNVPTPPSGELSTISDPGEPNMETTIARRVWPNRPLLTTGSVLLVGSYVPSVIGAALSDRNEDDNLYIPVAGPWMTLTRGEEESGGEKALLVASGAVQGVGALMMLSSFVIPEHTTRNWRLFGRSDVQLVPQQMRAGFGLGAAGRF